VLLLDLFQRWAGVDHWYTDAGLIPTHLARHVGFGYKFSLFHHASTHGEAVFGMALCGIVYLLFTLGWATRLVHLLAIVCVISLNNRIFLLENSGHAVLNLLCIWSAFLPLGRRFSVDAWLAARRACFAGAERDPALAERPVVSLAVLALLLQFSVIYFFSAFEKTGDMWWDGSAVHYVLHDERMNTAFAVWARENLPASALRLMTWSTLAVEWLAPVLFLAPFFVRHFRLAAVLLLPALHAGFALGLTLGIFSFAMMSFYALLLAPEHWAWLARHVRAPRFVSAWGARLARLPPLVRGRLAAAAAGLHRTVTRVVTRRWVRFPAIGLREAAIVLLAAACVSDLAVTIPSWPKAWRFKQPELFRAMIWYPRIRQFWLMFTPQPPDTVLALAVEAYTEDGRLVDPYNEVASRYPMLSRTALAPHHGQSQPFSDYTSRMPQKGFEWCHVAFVNWVLAYPSRTGNPSDRIVRFHAYRVLARIPPPGSNQLGTPQYYHFLSFP
jgi:hypothetical protein